jgi:hypothetical protein
MGAAVRQRQQIERGDKDGRERYKTGQAKKNSHGIIPIPFSIPARMIIFRFYWRAVETLVYVSFRSPPKLKAIAMMAIEMMPAATKPYSIAVAADWSFTKRKTRARIE